MFKVGGTLHDDALLTNREAQVAPAISRQVSLVAALGHVLLEEGAAGRLRGRGRGRRSGAALAASEVVSERLGLVDGLLLALGVVGVDIGRRRVAGGLA